MSDYDYYSDPDGAEAYIRLRTEYWKAAKTDGPVQTGSSHGERVTYEVYNDDLGFMDVRATREAPSSDPHHKDDSITSFTAAIIVNDQLVHKHFTGRKWSTSDMLAEATQWHRSHMQ